MSCSRSTIPEKSFESCESDIAGKRTGRQFGRIKLLLFMPTFHVTITLQTEFRLMGDPGLFEGFIFDSSLPDGPVDLLHLSVEADDFPTADRIAVERAAALVDKLSYITKSAWAIDHHSSMIAKTGHHPMPKIFSAAKLKNVPDDLFENTKGIKSYDGNALSLYRQALAARSALEKYLNFYRVLELCIGGTNKD